ncbi:MAG: DNA primase family protein [Acidimicrobiales bacterium]
MTSIEDRIMAGLPPAPAEKDPEQTGHYEATELGNARRLVDDHGHDLRYVAEWGKWLVWTGRCWQVDNTGAVHRRAKQIADRILDEARAGSDDKLFRWGIKSQSNAGINNTIALASTEATIPVLVDELDTDPWLLTVANGTIDLRTGLLGPHRRQDLLTKSTDVIYDEHATCPQFLKFLEAVLPDATVLRFLQRAIGYSLTGTVLEHALFFGYGAGANGKSTLMRVLLDMAGEHGAPAPPRLLIADRHPDHPTSVAALHGRRVVIAQELDQASRLDEPTVKEITGGDRLTARYMRQDFWSFAPTHKVWLCANHKPAIRGTDLGIWRRIKLIPFTVSIAPDDQDEHLAEHLADELPGILRWAIAGCLEWQRRGLDTPEAVVKATEQYRLEQDVIGQFIADCCTTNPMLKVQSTPLYEAYKAWCVEQGITHPLSQKALAPRIEEHGYIGEPDRKERTWWQGLGLRTEESKNMP